ncbi:hypothetical protein [Alkalimarinus sediminis]|uniref:Uncharacterized protein n=1 Tax=Alkalimarinus sediminis TaxID=1632866 RepID=A0A9E8HKK9_9ALTE|nr:hypothetical protein [Alkalimarinus sediminis]UZW74521.1 hypothetical protein NNL22_16080 [Alkalimarinus sediminis]
MIVGRDNLINLNGEDSFEALVSFWGGKLEKEAALFVEETGEDYEQCLVEQIASIKHPLSKSGIKLVCKRFEGDKQFYELAHMLIQCVFGQSTADLNENQIYILKELCEHTSVWQSDEYFTELLSSLSLPSSREAMLNYLNENV